MAEGARLESVFRGNSNVGSLQPGINELTAQLQPISMLSVLHEDVKKSVHLIQSSWSLHVEVQHQGEVARFRD